MDDRHLLGDESNPWRSRILIGSILASELGVLLALFTSMFQPETDPVQFVSRLSILFAALFGLSILRRKALPATSESYPRPGCQGQGTAAAPGVWIGTAGRSAADPGDPLVVPPVDPTPIRLNPARLNLSSDQQG